jgi:hypothetical protein
MISIDDDNAFANPCLQLSFIVQPDRVVDGGTPWSEGVIVVVESANGTLPNVGVSVGLLVESGLANERLHRQGKSNHESTTENAFPSTKWGITGSRRRLLSAPPHFQFDLVT